MKSTILFALLLFGCVGMDNNQNESLSNSTITNTTINSTENNELFLEKSRYTTTSYTFQYPKYLTLQKKDHFLAINMLKDKVLESFFIKDFFVIDEYPPNKEKLFLEDPSEAAVEILKDFSIEKDYNFFDYSTFSIDRSAFCAQAEYTRSINDTRYQGFFIVIYVPEKSLIFVVDIYGIDIQKTREIREDFIHSFRLEK